MNETAVYTDVKACTDHTALIASHGTLVKKIAHHLANRLPAHIQINDLIQSGMIGLIEASNNFQSDKGASFESFASIRIRGAMIDDIRKNDWIPRSVYQMSRKITNAIKEIENREQRPAQAQEVANLLGISLEEYNRQLNETACCDLFSLDDLAIEPKDNQENNNPFNIISDKNLKFVITELIKELPEREQLILSLHVNDEVNFKDIGKLFEISESRVCQLHSQAISRLRARLQKLQS